MAKERPTKKNKGFKNMVNRRNNSSIDSSKNEKICNKAEIDINNELSFETKNEQEIIQVTGDIKVELDYVVETKKINSIDDLLIINQSVIIEEENVIRF